MVYMHVHCEIQKRCAWHRWCKFDVWWIDQFHSNSMDQFHMHVYWAQRHARECTRACSGRPNVHQYTTIHCTYMDLRCLPRRPAVPIVFVAFDAVDRIEQALGGKLQEWLGDAEIKIYPSTDMKIGICTQKLEKHAECMQNLFTFAWKLRQEDIEQARD